MVIKYKILLIVSILLLANIKCEDDDIDIPDDIKKLQLNTNYDYVIQNPEKGLNVYVQFESEPESDYAVIIQPLDFTSDPEIFISNTEQYPDEGTSILKCAGIGGDVCVVPKSRIKKNSKLYMSIQCSTKCQFTLSVEPTTKDLVDFNKETRLVFKGKFEKFLKVKVDQLGQDTKGIIFRAQFIERRAERPDDIKMYINKSDDELPSTSISPIQSIRSWGNGRVASVKKGDQYFGEQTDYTILITVTGPCIVSFIARDFKTEQEIQLNSQKNDVGFPNITTKYILKIPESLTQAFKTGFISFDLIIYEGNSDLYVGCKKDKLDDLGQYEWVSVEWGKKYLTISGTDYTQKCTNQQDIIIAVQGQIFSAYTLNVELLSENKKALRVGIPELGSLTKNEIFLYSLTLDNFQNDVKVTLTLTPNLGNPDLYIKRCSTQSKEQKCTFDQSDIQYVQEHKDQLTQDDRWIKYSDNTQGLDIVRFSHSLMYNPCEYIVGIVGKQETNSYTLIVGIDDKLIVLRESQTQIYQIDNGIYSNFVFTLYDNTDVNFIDFQLTPISGNPTLYSSQTIERPTKKDNQFDYQSSSDTNMISYQNDKLLKGSYYISVLGNSDASTYSITANVKRNNQKRSIALSNNIPQKYVFNENEQACYFHFYVDIEKTKPQISFNLIKIRGNFDYYIDFNGKQPTQISYYMKSEGSRLIISPDSPLYPQKENSLEIKIVVYPKQENPKNNQFIMVASIDNYQFLYKPGVTEKIILKPQQQYKFKLVVNKEKSSLAIKGESLDNCVSLSLTTNDEQQSISRPQMKFTSNEKGEITLDYEEQLKPICPYLLNENDRIPCIFYLEAKNPTNEFQELRLTYTRGSNHYLLLEDEPQTQSLKLKGESSYFQIEPKNYGSDLYILVTTDDGIIALGYKILDGANDDVNQHTNIEVKSEQVNPEISYRTSKITIPSKQLNIYGSNTIVFIRVFVEENIRQEHKEKTKSEDTIYFGEFTIQANTGVSVLKEGDPFEDSVIQSSYNYYSFDVLEKESEIQFLLTRHSESKIDILVNKLDSTKNLAEQLPTKANSPKWQSSGNTDIIKIIKEQIPTQDMNGTYIIGIFGQDTGSYSLTAVARKHKIIQLDAGIPFNIEIQKDSTIYFTYSHTQKSTAFQFISNVESGSTEIKLAKDDLTNQNILTDEYLKTFQTHKIINSGINTYNKIQISPFDGEFYKAFKQYLFAVKATKNTRISILISVEGVTSLIQLSKLLFDSVNSQKSKKYIFTINSKSNHLIQLDQYSGNVDIYFSSNPVLDKSTAQQGVIEKIAPEKGQSREDQDDFKSKNKKLIKIDAQSLPSDYQTKKFYVFIENNLQEDSNYIISIKSSQSLISLVQGRFESGILNAQQKQEFIFDSNILEKDQQKQNQEGQVILYTYTTSKQKYEHPKIQFLYQNGNQFEAIKEIIHETKLPGVTIYKFKMNKLNYKINLQNDNPHEISYEILVNNEGIVNLGFDQVYYSNITAGKSEIFAVNVLAKGTILFEIYDCIGNIELKLFTQYISKSSTGLQFETIPNSKNILLNVQNPGIFYFEVTSQQNEQSVQQQFGNYIFFKSKVSQLTNQAQSPHLNIVPGNSGQITHKSISLKETKVRLSWFLPKFSDSLTEQINQDQIYFYHKLFISEDNSYKQLSLKCPELASTIQNTQLPLVNLVANGQDYSPGTEFSFDRILTPNKDYYINLVINVRSDDNRLGQYSGGYPLWYNELKINYNIKIPKEEEQQQQEKPGNGMSILAAILIILVVVLGSGLVFFYIKWKKAKLRLQYELNQITTPSIDYDRTDYRIMEEPKTKNLLKDDDDI